MNRSIPTAMLLAALMTMGACGPGAPGTVPANPPDASPPSPGPSNTNANAGDVNPEHPSAGKNEYRPDSITDVKPGADGNSSPRTQ
jgi:hypothetical protein